MFGFGRPEREKAIIKALEPTVSTFGVSGPEGIRLAESALDEIKNIFASKPEFDLYAGGEGTRLIGNSEFMKPRLAAGLTAVDIETFWNRPPILVLCQMKLEDQRPAVHVHAAIKRGEDGAQAATNWRRNNPMYGDPTTNRSEDPRWTEADAPLFHEFGPRVDNWRRFVDDRMVVHLMKGRTSFNALARSLVADGKL